MSTVTESDLKRLEDLIINRFSDLDRKLNELESRFDKVDSRLEKLSEESNAIRVDLATVKGEAIGTNKRIDDLNTRLNTFTLGFLSIVGILVTGILGIVGKVVFFPNP